LSSETHTGDTKSVNPDMMAAGLIKITKSGDRTIDQKRFMHFVGLDDVNDFFTKYV
jgi:hypothetical protein